MKSRPWMWFVVILTAPLLVRGEALPPISNLQFPFYVYHGFHARENHFAPSGWMGDYGDIRFDDHFNPIQKLTKQ